ncbi:unnamed protein product, partial [Vitis vinifera]
MMWSRVHPSLDWIRSQIPDDQKWCQRCW